MCPLRRWEAIKLYPCVCMYVFVSMYVCAYWLVLHAHHYVLVLKCIYSMCDMYVCRWKHCISVGVAQPQGSWTLWRQMTAWSGCCWTLLPSTTSQVWFYGLDYVFIYECMYVCTGGQIFDTGYLLSSDGTKFSVTNSQTYAGYVSMDIIHTYIPYIHTYITSWSRMAFMHRLYMWARHPRFWRWATKLQFMWTTRDARSWLRTTRWRTCWTTHSEKSCWTQKQMVRTLRVTFKPIYVQYITIHTYIYTGFE